MSLHRFISIWDLNGLNRFMMISSATTPVLALLSLAIQGGSVLLVWALLPWRTCSICALSSGAGYIQKTCIVW